MLAIGSPRALAHAAGEAHEGRPRWTFGVAVAGLVLAALSYAWLFSVLGFADGVLASGVTGREVSGTSFPWGTELTATVQPGNTGLRCGRRCAVGDPRPRPGGLRRRSPAVAAVHPPRRSARAAAAQRA